VTTTQQDAERASELAALREAVRDLIEGSGGIAAARQRLSKEPGYDQDAWRLLGTEMGLAGLGLAEDLGGAGGGLAELTVVAEELGRALLPVPFFSSTVLAGQILARCPGTGRDVLAQVAEGGELAAFAGTDLDGCWRPDRLPVQVKAEGRPAKRTSSWTEQPPRTWSWRPARRPAATCSWSPATPKASRQRPWKPWTRPAPRPASP
jgi:alkylation response protein AidB-like acyl-CoA dehydrogenase